MVHIVVDRKGHPGVRSVDRSGGGEVEVLKLVMTAALEDIQEAGEVALHIRVGVFERIADARLGGQVDDDLEPFVREKRFHGFPVGQIHPDETEILFPLEYSEARLLQCHVVIGVQVVETDDVPLREAFMK
jgi:hypothetical protein